MHKEKQRLADEPREGGVYIDGVNVTKKAKEDAEKKEKKVTTKKEVNKNVTPS